MKSLLIIGAGGYGHLIKEIAEMNGYEKIAFLDDKSLEAIGRIEDIEKYEGEFDNSIVAIGNPDIREELYKKIKYPVTLVHPNALVSKSAVVEQGCVIEGYAVVSSKARIGYGSYICAGAVVNHDAIVGSFCQVDCNAVVACGTKMREKCKVKSCSVYNL